MPAEFLPNWPTMSLAGGEDGKGSQFFAGAQAPDCACLEGSSQVGMGAGSWIGQGEAGRLFRFLVAVACGLTTKEPLLKNKRVKRDEGNVASQIKGEN